MASGAVGYGSAINRGNGSIAWLLVGPDGADCHLQVLDVATAKGLTPLSTSSPSTRW